MATDVFKNIPNSGAQNWKASVASFAALPTNGNTLTDTRITDDTLSIYTWDGTEWKLQSTGGGGVNSISSDGSLTVTGTATDPIVSITTHIPNTIAGFDTSGALNPVVGSIADNNGQIQLQLGNTLPSDNINQLILDPTISTPLSNGYEGIIAAASFSSTMTFMSAYNAEINFNTGFNNSGGIGIYQDQSNFSSGAISGNYASFISFATIDGTVSNAVQGVEISPTVNNTIGNFQGYVSSPVLNSAYHDTNGVDGFRESGTLAAGAISNQYNSFGANPILSGTISGEYNGIQINPNGAASIGSAFGVNITMSNLTGIDPHLITGINSDSSIQLDVSQSLLSNQGFQIINRIESEVTSVLGSPVTGSDSIGNDFAGDLDAQDNIADGPTGGLVGWSGVGFISELLVGSGKTVSTANIFLAASALPAPTSPETDGGTITHLSMIKTAAPLNEGGSLNITNLYGFKLDTTLTSFSGSATNAWGLYLEDPNLNNYIQGSLNISTVTQKVSNSDVALEIGGVKAFLPGRMTTTQRNSMTLVEGMVIYNTDLHKLQYWDSSTWQTL